MIPGPGPNRQLLRALGQDRWVEDTPANDVLASGVGPVAVGVAPTMTLVARPLAMPEWGFDTSEHLTVDQYLFMKSLGATFAIRYVPLAGQSAGLGIDLNEVYACCVTAKLGLMLVQFSRSSGLTQQQGLDDGEAFLLRASALGYPKTCSAWGDFYPSTATAMKAYGNSWYTGTMATTLGVVPFDPYAAGGYWEPGVPAGLNLENDYYFHRYWRSGADVPNVESRGYQLFQGWPGNRVPKPGLVVDYDFAWSDWKGSYPIAAFAA